MNRHEHIGFHACQTKDDPIFPFLSNDHEKTWLTQGYYFWTDSDSWAKFWGERAIKKDAKGCYAILECAISLDKNELLDLVGNAKHLELFTELIKHIETKSTVSNLTVSTVIKTLRESDFFPFLAVKVADYPKEGYKFSASMKEKLATLNRQQMCVFEQAKDRIRFIVKKEICVGK